MNSCHYGSDAHSLYLNEQPGSCDIHKYDAAAVDENSLDLAILGFWRGKHGKEVQNVSTVFIWDKRLSWKS